ncbi:MAG: threonylcarbamoyl-AMP synthase [Myxococcales bacterium]|nr:threonylcarbamoyl-AMP synthase [Myxococcales bacterium]
MRILPAEAVDRLLAGSIVAIPTETVYGLAADGLNEAAVRAIFVAKGRPADHPLILHVADAERAAAHARWDERADLLLDLWPGPLTLVLWNRDVPAIVRGGHPTVAMRVPDHPIALEILSAVGPLAAPSANRFGGVSPTRVEHVGIEFPGLPVVDGGPCRVGVESTIVSLLEGRPRLLRPGSVSLEELMARLGGVEVGGTIAAPGNLEAHYAPRGRVVLVPHGTPGAHVPAPERTEHARRLYDDLRHHDALGVDPIVCELAAPVGIGLAVNDRLMRAAAG